MGLIPFPRIQPDWGKKDQPYVVKFVSAIHFSWPKYRRSHRINAVNHCGFKNFREDGSQTAAVHRFLNEGKMHMIFLPENGFRQNP